MVGIILTEPEQPLVAETKCCTKCGEVKALTEFYFQPRSKTKFRSQCKKCVIGPPKPKKEKNPIPWLDRPGNREKQNEQRRAKYAANPQKYRDEANGFYHRNAEVIGVKRRAHYAENREAMAAAALVSHKANYATTRKWRAENPDKVSKYNKNFALRHPGHHIPHRHIRRARKMSVGYEKLRRGYRERLMEWQNHQCPYCKVSLTNIKAHMDHIIPLSRGGAHTELNIQYTCQRCNQRKHAKHPFDFAAEMGIVQNPIYIPI